MIRRILQHARRKGGQRGFTLIEVLVSLVLLALVLSLLTGAVRFARGTWDAAARLDLEAGFDAASFTRARLGEAAAFFEPGEAGLVRVAFKGTGDSVKFVAPAQSGPAGAGLYRHVLELEPAGSSRAAGNLLVSLAPYQPRQPRETAELPLEKHVLAENVKAVAFRYFGRKDLRSAPEWHTAWPRTDALPDLVEMAITHSGRESPAPLVIELRLRHRT